MTYPLSIIYCGKCGLLPEYCEFSPKQYDLDECKKWLKLEHPLIFDKMYPAIAVVEGEEEKKDEPAKKKKKVVKIQVNKRVRVIKLRRGGKKIICEILGLELFGCNLAEVAKMLGKKLGTGAAAVQVEYKEIN